MDRRRRSDSTADMAETVQRALEPVEPPTHMQMSDDDRLHFDAIVEEFPRAYWTDHQKQIAVLLARCMSDMNDHQMRLRVEGPTIKTDRGTPVVNPLKVMVQMHASTIDKYRRALALNPGEKRDRTGADKRKPQEKAAQQAASDTDNLIPMPRAVG